MLKAIDQYTLVKKNQESYFLTKIFILIIRLIYSYFNDDVAKLYLNNQLQKDRPQIIRISYEKINIAVVGCGRIAGHHCGAIKSNENFNLVAVCDLEKSKSNEYSKEFDTLSYDNYNTMLLENEEIDIVTIATPSGMHYEHAYEIIENYQKNIIVEKPTFPFLTD